VNLASKLRKFLPQENKPPAPAAKGGGDLDHFLHGQEVDTPYGVCYVVEKAIPIKERHGHWPLQKALDAVYDDFGRLGQTLPQPLQVRNALFLDTETTGLAGGTGTYAFLVGLGAFTDTHFLVKQLLMRDYNEELALLYLLDQELQTKDTLISFNGKTFDLPLLQTRFTISRLGFQGCNGKSQLDLLHPSRRIWRHKLQSCSLNSLEANILGVRRIDDIPGFEIPGRYFEFLHTGKGELLAGILEHNVIDIVSMASLLYRLHSIIELEPGECNCPWEAEALGLLALNGGHYNQSLFYFDVARESCQDREQQIRVLRTSALICKRLGHYEEASALWKQLLELASDDLLGYEELAKYYEHRLKDLAAAKQVTRRALALAWRSKSQKAAELEHRLRRLEKKGRAKQKE
jgi:hypothetical protein